MSFTCPVHKVSMAGLVCPVGPHVPSMLSMDEVLAECVGVMAGPVGRGKYSGSMDAITAIEEDNDNAS